VTLFGRRCVVQVDTLRIEGLDVRFTIELDEKLYGKAEISIFNLNRDHRKKLEDAKDVDVELLAGYQNNTLELLCAGTMREVFSQRDHPDWITTIKTGDGDKASSARLNRSYSAGTQKSTLWKDLVDAIKATGIGAGNAIEAFENGEYANGIKELLHGGAVQGSAMGQLREMAKSANLDLSIQEGELLLTQVGQPLSTTAVVLSPTSGLIGSPQAGTKGEVKARALLLPGLKPKRQVEIKSELVSGMYVITKAKYTGDTSGNDWYADIICKGL